MMKEIEQTAAREGISQSSVINRALERYFSTKISRSSWETVSDDEWYNERSFYTHAADKQGHSIQVRMWIPKNLAGQVGRVVGSGAIPEYREPMDFYRDAIFHRGFQVARWIDDNELTREITMLILKAEEDMIAQQKADAETLIEATKRNLDDAIQRGDIDWMKAHIKDRLSKSLSVPEAYREEYVAMLKQYEQMIKARTSHLRVVEEEKEPEAPSPRLARQRGRPRKTS